MRSGGPEATLVDRPRGGGQARPRVLNRKLRVLGHDVIGAQPVGDQAHHGRDRDARPGHARNTAHDPVIDRNTPDVHPHIVGRALPGRQIRRTAGGRLSVAAGRNCLDHIVPIPARRLERERL
jgi:hypothetical protein